MRIIVDDLILMDDLYRIEEVPFVSKKQNLSNNSITKISIFLSFLFLKDLVNC